MSSFLLIGISKILGCCVAAVAVNNATENLTAIGVKKHFFKYDISSTYAKVLSSSNSWQEK